jgi:hypothetical protein
MRKFTLLLTITIFLFIFSSCGGGGGGGNDAPAEGKITISGAPDTITIIDTETNWYEYCCFVIVVKDANGIPLNNVNLSISYPWAIPNPPGLVQLYDGDTPEDSPMDVTTDGNGAFYLKIRYQGGLVEYTGSLIVVSGSLSATAKFEVSTE